MKKPSSPAFVDITGNTYSRWTVISFAEQRNGGSFWNCKCTCGTERAISGATLKAGLSKSCGCYKREVDVSKVYKHGLTGTDEHNIYMGMRQRCGTPSHRLYPHYGALGVKICDRWMESFENFLEDMGPRPSKKHSIDRFPDPAGNYEPSNCRWATSSQQNSNKRTFQMITISGITKNIRDWSTHTGIKMQTIHARIRNGWTPQDAVTLPLTNGRTTGV